MSNWSPLSVSKIWEYFKLQAEISGEPVGCSGNEAAVIKLRGLQRLNRIALYLAIGGSFEPAPELPTLPKVERHILAPMLFLTRVSVTMSHHLIVLPDDTAKPILDAVNRAKKSLNIRMFLFTDPGLVNAVIAANRGALTGRQKA